MPGGRPRDMETWKHFTKVRENGRLVAGICIFDVHCDFVIIIDIIVGYCNFES